MPPLLEDLRLHMTLVTNLLVIALGSLILCALFGVGRDVAVRVLWQSSITYIILLLIRARIGRRSR